MTAVDDRTRLDEALVARGLAADRGRAQALVAAGLVEVDGARARSAGARVGAAAAMRVTGREHRWASRGGLKLEAALDALAVDCQGRVCLDAGASNGGFTDVLLDRGAARVYAVDVGRGLLDPRLAADARVVVLDRTNVRSLREVPGPVPSLVTIDLSFISVRMALTGLADLAPRAEVVALFKPQFEVARDDVGPGGVVRDPGVVATALDHLDAWVRSALGGDVLHEPVPAAVRGAKGNQEWFVHLRLPDGRT